MASLDRVNLSDRNAISVVGAVAQALGTPALDISLSRSTIHRNINQIRQIVVETDKASFSSQHSLVLHWDSKLLPNVVDGVQKVDRVAVLVSGGLEKLLAVPEIIKGTGKEQADACLTVLDEWQLKDQVRGLCFDTKSSNTGLNLGACSLIENSLAPDKKLVFIACRHHVFEVMLSSVFKEVFGPSEGPDVNLFKRLKKKWLEIDPENFIIGHDNFFNTENLLKLRQDMQKHYIDAIKTQQLKTTTSNCLNCVRSFSENQKKLKFDFMHQEPCIKLVGWRRQFIA